MINRPGAASGCRQIELLFERGVVEFRVADPDLLSRGGGSSRVHFRLQLQRPPKPPSTTSKPRTTTPIEPPPPRFVSEYQDSNNLGLFFFSRLSSSIPSSSISESQRARGVSGVFIFSSLRRLLESLFTSILCHKIATLCRSLYLTMPTQTRKAASMPSSHAWRKPFSFDQGFHSILARSLFLPTNTGSSCILADVMLLCLVVYSIRRARVWYRSSWTKWCML